MDNRIYTDEWLLMVQRHFSQVRTLDEANGILWSLTAFPFVGHCREGFDHYNKQLAELSVKADGDLSRAYAISDDELEAAMRKVSR